MSFLTFDDVWYDLFLFLFNVLFRETYKWLLSVYEILMSFSEALST